MFRPLMILALLLLPVAASAQQAATLIADRIEATANNLLIASGSVEVFFDGTRLTASRITYDQSKDQLGIEGPILITAPNGEVLTASQATMDARLETGILIGARLVLDRRLQLAANQVTRGTSGRTQLYKVAATSCAVCGQRAPIWQIRARDVTHDEENKQLYFTDARFMVRGVPIVALPRLRMPDPTQTRATGLLIPEIRTNNQLGIGIRIPYFIKLGDRRDVTLAPYLSSKTTTLELRYRQAFGSGTLEINGAASNDSLLADRLRSYVDAQARFDVGRDFVLDMKLRAVSDSGYLLQYGYSENDRLDSNIRLSRYYDKQYTEAELAYYLTLSSTLNTDNPPPLVFEVRHERQYEPAVIGGTAAVAAAFETHVRTQKTGINQRDVARIGASAHWSRQWIAPMGIVAEVQSGLDLSHYRIFEDTSFDSDVSRATPSGQITLRWPFSRSDSRSSQIIEPFVTAGWSKTYGGNIPNEDSTRGELDEGNLLDLSRFPGEDRSEDGFRAAAGVAWQGFASNGFSTRLAFGRAYRGTTSAYTATSGLNAVQSDWLTSLRVGLPNGFSVAARGLFKDDLNTVKSSAEITWAGENVQLGASFVYLDADISENRPNEVSEWTFDGAFQINDQWSIEANGRYDVARGQPARAGLGFGWQNECLKVNLSADRRFTSSSTVEPSTDFGLSIELLGFGAGPVGAASVQHCSQ